MKKRAGDTPGPRTSHFQHAKLGQNEREMEKGLPPSNSSAGNFERTEREERKEPVI